MNNEKTVWESEFDAKFNNAGGDYDGSTEPIKAFIRSHFISKSAMREKIEGMVRDITDVSVAPAAKSAVRRILETALLNEQTP